MKFKVLTIFPGMLDSYVHESILGRAEKKGLIEVTAVDIRDFTKNRHRKVDDRPYGGGAGMVLQVDPIARAVDALRKKAKRKKVRVVLFSTRGKKFDARMAKRLARYDELILICGRYEGVDERVAEYVADEEISIGDFILSGGELPALVVIDAVARQVKGVLGKEESLEEVQGSYPTYTRPPVFRWKKKNLKVPDVLLSGDHKKINEWREKHAEG